VAAIDERRDRERGEWQDRAREPTGTVRGRQGTWAEEQEREDREGNADDATRRPPWHEDDSGPQADACTEERGH
jgi:hypothetical protein